MARLVSVVMDAMLASEGNALEPRSSVQLASASRTSFCVAGVGQVGCNR